MKGGPKREDFELPFSPTQAKFQLALSTFADFPSSFWLGDLLLSRERSGWCIVILIILLICLLMAAILI
jgi:hypothetical protein